MYLIHKHGRLTSRGRVSFGFASTKTVPGTVSMPSTVPEPGPKSNYTVEPNSRCPLDRGIRAVRHWKDVSSPPLSAWSPIPRTPVILAFIQLHRLSIYGFIETGSMDSLRGSIHHHEIGNHFILPFEDLKGPSQ